MSQTDRILPWYFLSRVRVSVRPRIFLFAKKLQKHSLRPPITDRQRQHRQNGSWYLHARWRYLRHKTVTVTTQDRPLAAPDIGGSVAKFSTPILAIWVQTSYKFSKFL